MSNGNTPRLSATRTHGRRQRRMLSCLPCRLHKLRCDRAIPCQSCTRFGREDHCRLNPSPAAAAPAYTGGQASILPMVESRPESTSPANAGLLPPSSAAAQSAHVCDSGPAGSSTQAPHSIQCDGPNPASNSVSEASRQDVPDGDTVTSVISSRPYNISDSTLLDEPESFWKRYLISILPSQTQCDMLVSYFFENINWVYQAIHAPSFRSEYNQFWTSNVADVDLIWLSSLYMIICVGGGFIPSQMAEAAGFDTADLPRLSQRWYSASWQALRSGEYDSKPTLIQIQVFLISQLYWYNTKKVEVLNSHMGQAIRNAQAIGLDNEAPQSMNCLEREMRHRVWWDLASSDTFQSLSLGRSPLLQSHLTDVPFPSNSNDIDMAASSIRARPISEPTEMSVHYFRARTFKVLNKLYKDNGAHLSSYQFVAQIDAELNDILDEYPWYLREHPDALRRHLSPSSVTVLTWMRHILHSSICIQRMRMYRPFLNTLAGDSWQRCVAASASALTVYKTLRGPDLARFQRSQKMHVQAYQVFSAAVTLATFLLVEMPTCADVIRADIELVIDDLHAHCRSVDQNRQVPLILDGTKIIRRIIAFYDARCKHIPGENTTSSGRSGSDPSQPEEPPTALVPAIFSVFGGESTARRYLERCAVGYRADGSTSAEGSSSASGLPSAIFEISAWDALANPSQWGQDGDFWAELDLVLPVDDAVDA